MTMDNRGKVKNLFSYFLSLKNMNDKIIRSVNEYEKVFWEADLTHVTGCSISKGRENENWLVVNKKSGKLYDQFFKLYEEIEKRGEEIEIVWGHGLLVWDVNETNIMHPLFITRMELCFDSKKGEFTLRKQNKTEIDLSIFEGLTVNNYKGLYNLNEDIKLNDIDPRRIENIESLVYETAKFLSWDYDSFIDVQKDIFKISCMPVNNIKSMSYPIIYNLPVIIVRKNDIRLWQRDISSILEKIEKGYPMPKTIEALVDYEVQEEESNKKEWNHVTQDLLFPLPANDEQKEIVKKIAESYGVVVQGPPGTGKSHTIVNLICHLLAHGKKVLVTSQTDRALNVLSDKIPKEIKPLCVCVPESDSRCFKEISDSIEKIVDNLSIDKDILLKDIAIFEKRLETCRRKQFQLSSILKEKYSSENSSINYHGQNYRLMDIAKWVRENEKEYGYIEDKIGGRINPPVNEEEMQRMLYLISNIDKDDMETAGKVQLILDRLPKCEELLKKINDFKKYEDKIEECRLMVKDWRVLEGFRNDYEKLIKFLKESVKKIEEINSGWYANLANKYYSSKIVKDAVNYMYLNCESNIRKLGKIARGLNDHNIELPEKAYADMEKFNRDFDMVYDVLCSKGKISKVFRVMHTNLNYIFAECKVDGRNIESSEQAIVVKLFLEQNDIIKNTVKLWNNTVKTYNGDVLKENIEDIVKLESYLNNIRTIVTWDENYKEEILRLFRRIDIPMNMDWYSAKTYRYLLKCVESLKYIYEYNELKAYIEVLKKMLLTSYGMEELYEAVDHFDVDGIIKYYDKVEKVRKIMIEVNEVNIILDKLKEACPLLGRKIVNEIDRKNIAYKYRNWDMAWKWKVWSEIVESSQKIDINLVETELKEEREKEKYLIKEIVVKRTWYNQMLTTTEQQKRSLFNWMQAVKRIGKGTGKFTSEYRRIAQNEMEICKDMIPVWIMPLNRIIETIKLPEKQFDVIIFDESSQSNVMALCALMRAKKAVIVGDDMQISPEIIGVDQAAVKKLIEDRLKDIPDSQWFDLQTSLYDTALRAFPERLMLKEHFRCIPEIIGFSNSFCYSGDIVPLRYAEAYERFNPSIGLIKVEKGFRDERRPVNIPEAKALVNKIEECCNDRRYKGMTMGVISLLGDEQAEVIQDMLRGRIGEEEMVERRLVCGDAYCFQGDERDIMFLSMVIGENVKFAPLARESDIRRFNVAASRARNQMWVFYSVDINKVSHECARYSLLKYCENYKKYICEPKNVVNLLKSKFQKDVYAMIKEKGMRVIPKVNVGRFIIDFVIEGNDKRIGVICIGDGEEMNESMEEQLLMQMDLERVGWSFCKIMGSEFYYNPMKAMEKLWNKIEKLNEEIGTA